MLGKAIEVLTVRAGPHLHVWLGGLDLILPYCVLDGTPCRATSFKQKQKSNVFPVEARGKREVGVEFVEVCCTRMSVVRAANGRYVNIQVGGIHEMIGSTRQWASRCRQHAQGGVRSRSRCRAGT